MLQSEGLFVFFLFHLDNLFIENLSQFFFGRFTGLIVGIADVDPVRWPGSRWRCLMVYCGTLSNLPYCSYHLQACSVAVDAFSHS